MCIQWTRVLYSVVITWRSNPPVSQFNSLCNEFLSVWSMFVYTIYWSSSFRSPTRPVQQQWWSWWSSSGPPSPHIISGEVELLKATVRFALVGVCYIFEEHARLSGPPHHRDTLAKERFLVSCACVRHYTTNFISCDKALVYSWPSIDWINSICFFLFTGSSNGW